MSDFPAGIATFTADSYNRLVIFTVCSFADFPTKVATDDDGYDGKQEHRNTYRGTEVGRENMDQRICVKSAQDRNTQAE
jgi:hypothetical protein